MIEKIIPDRISLTLPTVFGEELTFLEFCGKLRAKLNECIDVVNENTSNIEDVTSKTSENTANIQQNATAISRNESDIVKLNGVVNSISAQADENTADILNRKIESLFAPVILNVESHSLGADINASAYVRISRINYNGLGCLYAKVNLSFSGATDAKTLKILSVQFGKRSILSLDDPAPTFTAKTNVFDIPISVVGTETLPVGTSDIAVTGLNFFETSENVSDISSAITLEYIPTGKDIPCDSLAFTSPGGGESDPKFVYTLKISEGNIDIYLTSGGKPLQTEQAILKVDFTSTISDPMIYDQFVCAGGVYDEDTMSSIAENGQVLGAALINHTEYTDNGHVYNARMIIRDADNSGTSTFLSLKPTGIADKKIPFGLFTHISLTFDMFN